MMTINSRIRKLFTLVICLGAYACVGNAAETDPDGALFVPSEDPLADVQQALTRASSNDRRALVVLGANWCHDSRALAARLNKSPLSEVIEENYELVVVDVGFYEQGREVTQQFGVPQFYATPTVLVVDPSSGQVVDGEESYIWGNAYRVSMSESVEYFEKWADEVPAGEAESAELQKLFTEIDQFEAQAADRVAAGYAIVGPMLAAYKEGNEHDDFDARWDELADFRMSIPKDIRELRDEARKRVSEGEVDIQLEYPEYPPLSWETEL